MSLTTTPAVLNISVVSNIIISFITMTILTTSPDIPRDKCLYTMKNEAAGSVVSKEVETRPGEIVRIIENLISPG